MRHVFRATKIGWERERVGIWFDSAKFTKEEAMNQFKAFRAISQKGYPYTGYEYDGEKYHDVIYLGEYDDNDMPQDDWDYIRRLPFNR